MAVKESYTFENKEFIFLAAMNGGNNIIGVNDPFEGALAEQVQECWQIYKKELLKKEYIKILQDGSISINADIANVLGTCCFPDELFIIDRKEENKPDVMYYYYIKDNGIIQKSEIEETSNLLKKIHGREAMEESIVNILNHGFGNSNGGSIDEDSSVIEDAILTEIKKLAQTDKEQSKTKLLTAHPEFKDAEDFILALSSSCSSILACYHMNNNGKVYGIGIIEGKNFTWGIKEVRVHDRNCFKIFKMDTKILMQEINSII